MCCPGGRFFDLYGWVGFGANLALVDGVLALEDRFGTETRGVDRTAVAARRSLRMAAVASLAVV